MTNINHIRNAGAAAQRKGLKVGSWPQNISGKPDEISAWIDGFADAAGWNDERRAEVQRAARG